MADWDEIKRLAADFQKVQLSSTAQRLSERNCIEIVNLLIQKKLIDLIFTTDGKEYLTPAQLVQDIKNELYDNGGRVNLVDIAKSLDVDLAHVNTHINDVLKGQKDMHLILGQLIDNSYILDIAAEINQKLQQQGQISVSDLTIQYDLPADFLQQQVLEKQLGKIIQAKQDKNDPKVFFTESFIARSKAKMKGALAGLTRPTPITIILAHIGLSEKLFFSLFDQVAMYGSLTSRLAGAQYVPHVYSRSQNEWVSNFYRQNGYLEYDALTRLGITDYKTYLKKQLASEQTYALNSCLVSKRIIEQVEADIEECIASKSFVDLQSNLPSVFDDDDLQELLKIALTKQREHQTIVIDNFILSKVFVDDLSRSCEGLVKEKAKNAVESGRYQQYITSLQVSGKSQKQEEIEEVKSDKREERRKKAAGGKSGGGHQGRETKTKSTKKASRVVKGSRDDEEAPVKKSSLEIFNEEDIKSLIHSKLEEEGLDDLMDGIVEHLLPNLNEKALTEAADVYAATVSDRTSSRRQTHNELQNKLNTLIGDARLFEKGIKVLPSDVQPALYKYLLKTLCTDVANEILKYLVGEQGVEVSCDNLSNEQRLKMANDLPSEAKAPVQNLIKSLSGQNLDDFMVAVEESLAACSMIIKKIDKKKDRLIVLNHKHSLLEELNKCEDAALALHLTVLVIFMTATQNMLHASGRHVTSLLSFLKQYLKEEDFAQLSAFHDLVTLMLGGGEEAENAKEQLKERMPVIKNIANEYKKSSDKS